MHYIDRSIFENRELSWLTFNERVLDEACYAPWPLMERLHFVHIFTNNLDEFYMIRVGTLFDQYQLPGLWADGKTGMTVEQQLEEIYRRTQRLMAKRDTIYTQVVGELAAAGVQQLRMSELGGSDLEYMQERFTSNILPLLSPQLIDKRHPFPHMSSKQMAVALQLEETPHASANHGADQTCMRMALILFPQGKRVLPLPSTDGALRFVLLEDVIQHFADQVFANYTVRDRCVFCPTRNADLSEKEGLWDEDVSYREFMAQLLKLRRRLAPVRLECSTLPEPVLKNFLLRKFRLPEKTLTVTCAPLSIDYLTELEGLMTPEQRKPLFFEGLRTVYPLDLQRNQPILPQVLKKDICINVPYESYKPFIALVREAAEDPTVQSIQVTLYRIGKNSTLIEHLIAAAENGKKVTVMVELRARFDEQRNIGWAVRLEEAGVQVLYGLEGYKVHGKLCLITRQIKNQVQYITQVGTGNYNEETVRQYTDLMIITANQAIGRDAASAFENLKQSKVSGRYAVLVESPAGLKDSFLKQVDGEIAKAKAGKPALVRVKCNGITDKEIIIKLAEASMAGVPVELIVRGILCMRPGLPGLTENIRVISIVGRFLEHSRIYSFGVGKERRTYISSADLMTRNTERRVEIACPLLDKNIEQRVIDLFEMQWKDNAKAREQLPDATYRQVLPPEGQPPVDSQYALYDWIKAQRQALDSSQAHQPKSLLHRWFKK